ncbi:MAG: type II secretion system F family protein [Candidatus Dormibacteria bacterium]
MTAPALLTAALAAGSVLAFVAYILSRSAPGPDAMALRLGAYGGAVEPPTPRRAERSAGLRGLVDILSNAVSPVLDRTSHAGRLADDLARADLKMKSSEWVLAVLGVGILIGLLLSLRFGTPILLVLGPAVAWLGSGFFLRFRQRRRTRAFERQLGNTVVLLSNALKAGNSFAQALSTVSKTASPPISEEFARSTREVALGISVDEALNHMVARNRSEDFDFLVTAVQIQRVVGGNLAEVLDTIAHTIRERVRIKGEIRALTAQARASGYIISFLPVALGGILSVISPSYFTPMFHEPAGLIMLGGAGLSVLAGFAIMQKIVKIEV